MADFLPMTLRFYRKLSYAMVPLAPALIRSRLKQGKEDPERVGERRGLSLGTRPHGPLVWIHGASVGEVLAAAGLIERLRALNLRILLTSGTVTSAAIVAKRFPPDVIHQYVPYDSPRYVARFLDHWRPVAALWSQVRCEQARGLRRKARHTTSRSRCRPRASFPQCRENAMDSSR